jgi:hypothetical protein
MALSLPGGGVNGLDRSAGIVDGGSDYACCFWAYIPSVPAAGTQRTFFQTSADDPVSGVEYVWLGMQDNGALSLDVGGTFFDTGSDEFGAEFGWHGVIYVRTGTSHRFWYDAHHNVVGGSPIAVTVDVSAWAFNRLLLGTFLGPNTQPFKIQYFREWSKAKSVNSLITELNSPTAVDTVGLVASTPLVSDLLDVSGNGRDWTQVGSGTFETGPIPTPATNTTEGAAQAIALVSGRTERLQIVHTLTSESPATYTTVDNNWYTWSASVTGAMGARVWSGLRTYAAEAILYIGDSSATLKMGGGLEPDSIYNAPFQFGVEAVSQLVTLRAKAVFPGANLVPAILHTTLQQAPALVVPDESIFVLPEQPNYPFPGMFVSVPTGAILGGIYPIATGEAGDVLLNRLLVEDSRTDQILLYRVQSGIAAPLTLFSTLVPPFPSTATGLLPRWPIRAHRESSRFYVSNGHSDPALSKLWSYTADGILVGAIYNLGVDRVKTIAVSNDRSILYFQAGPFDLAGTRTNIRRHDLVEDLPMSNLATGMPAPYVAADLFVLADDTILASFSKVSLPQAQTHVLVRRYAPNGALLNTYDFGTGVHEANGAPARLARAPEDPTAFWIWLHPGGPADADRRFTRFIKVRVSDGAYLVDRFDVPNFDFSICRGFGTYGEFAMPDFGVMLSCPLVILESDGSVGGGGGGGIAGCPPAQPSPVSGKDGCASPNPAVN